MLAMVVLVLGLISATSEHSSVRYQLSDFFGFLSESRSIDRRFIEECQTRCMDLANTLDIDLVKTRVHSTNLVFHMARTLGNICKHFQFRETLPADHESYEVLRTQMCELWSIVSKLGQLIN